MTRLIDDGKPSRRGFLAATAALAMTTLAPGVTLYAFGAANEKPPGGKASSARRWGFLIDAGKCGDGCDKCVTACKTENGWGGGTHPETDAQWIRKVTLKDAKSGRTSEAPVMCQHCASPPCVDVCPTGASFKRADGIVLVDKHICIGCRYCMMACPYKARSFVHEPLTDQKPWAPRGKGTVESCTMCVDRIDSGRSPACAEACSADGGGAMLFGDLNDPNSDISRAVASRASAQLRADLGLDPGVRYENL
jgi:molybdopterin-containing oxidoreductase family iron-sulfur binding subunit